MIRVLNIHCVNMDIKMKTAYFPLLRRHESQKLMGQVVSGCEEGPGTLVTRQQSQSTSLQQINVHATHAFKSKYGFKFYFILFCEFSLIQKFACAIQHPFL